MFFARYALWHLLDLYSAEIFEHGKCLSLYIPHCTPHTTSTRIQQQTPNSSTTTTTTEIALRSVRDLFPSLDGGQIMPSTTFVGRDQTPRLNAHAPSSQALLMICHNWCWQCHAVSAIAADVEYLAFVAAQSVPRRTRLRRLRRRSGLSVRCSSGRLAIVTPRSGYVGHRTADDAAVQLGTVVWTAFSSNWPKKI